MTLHLHRSKAGSAAIEDPDGEHVRDPVCGMTVDPGRSMHRALHEGRVYAFCCTGCRTKFEADPSRYDADRPRPEAPVPAGAGTIFTCPMHPEIEQVGPGSCPKCGMALEPKDASAEAGPNEELRDMTRRLWIAAPLTAPVVGLAMGGGPHPLSGIVEGILATGVVFGAGWPFWVRGWRSVVSRHLNMFTLIALGTGAAWAYSLVATLAPELFPASVRERDGAVGLYFEAAAVIITLVLVGQVLELRARDRTGQALRSLLDLAPKTARRITPQGEDDVALDDVRASEHLRVRPGDRVPVDGRLTEGSSMVDEAMVTGEAMPVAKQVGDTVIAGTLNRTGSFVMVADKVGRDTILAGIVTLVSTAQRSRAPIQRLADTVSGRFVPAVLLVAGLAFAAWLTLGPEPRFAHALVAAVSVLIVACPCALGLATPMSVMVGLGRGAQAGVLIRDAAALERLHAVDTLVFDKTGTLTEGRPAVRAIEPIDSTEDELLRLAASLEQGSEHPLARAVLALARDRGLRLAPAEDFAAAFGRGVTGRVEGRSVVVGTSDHLADQGIAIGADTAVRANQLRQEGGTAVFVGIDGALAGVLAIADPPKPSAATALVDLRRAKLSLVMATGDHATTAHHVGSQLGLDDIRSGLLPNEKAALVADLRAAGHVVAMAGDGINDAPALATADVGIAMGAGSDIAKESAAITLMRSDLHGLVRARRLSALTMRNIRQNLAFAFVYNLVGVPVAAGILYPAFGLTLSPMLAAAAMALSSVSVIANALRLGLAKLN